LILRSYFWGGVPEIGDQQRKAPAFPGEADGIGSTRVLPLQALVSSHQATAIRPLRCDERSNCTNPNLSTRILMRLQVGVFDLRIDLFIYLGSNYVSLRQRRRNIMPPFTALMMASGVLVAGIGIMLLMRASTLSIRAEVIARPFQQEMVVRSSHLRFRGGLLFISGIALALFPAFFEVHGANPLFPWILGGLSVLANTVVWGSVLVLGLPILLRKSDIQELSSLGERNRDFVEDLALDTAEEDLKRFQVRWKAWWPYLRDAGIAAFLLCVVLYVLVGWS